MAEKNKLRQEKFRHDFRIFRIDGILAIVLYAKRIFEPARA
jgi:hypothetical protein